MARSIAEIYTSIIDEKNNQTTLNGLQPAIDDQQTLLDDLSSPSKVARWRLWAFVTAVVMFAHESLWDAFRADVDESIAKFRPGTVRWYQEQAFAFQYGHQLVYQDQKYVYATEDVAAQIIKRCSVTEVSGVVRIKCAKLNGTTLEALTAQELAAVQAYFQKIKYPGPLQVVSFDPDIVRLEAVVYYDPIGDLPTIIANTEAAINAYMEDISVVRFDGRLNRNGLIDKVQEVGFVRDIDITLLEATYGLLPYNPVGVEYNTNAGYAKIDSANYPLSGGLTYQPYVQP